MGGAVVLVILGRIGDRLGLRTGVAFLYLIFATLSTRGVVGKAVHSQRHDLFEKAATESGSS